MARKALSHSLPRLRKAPCWKVTDNKTERLLATLRAVAQRHQKAEAQPFYPLREVACHFDVPLSTAATVYARLEKLGLLSPVRGSQTLLEGRQGGRELVVRGLIGMPISYSRMMISQDYRAFFMHVPRELRVRGFVAQMSYFEPDDLRTGELSARLKRFQTDTVLWLTPDLASRDTIATLREAGMRVFGVSDGGLPPVPCACEIRRETAVLQLLRTWRSSTNLNAVTVLSVPNRHAAADEQRLQAILEEAGWESDFADLSVSRPDALLDSLPPSEQIGLILPSTAASVLAFRAPDLLVDLLRTHRVALLDGPVTLPFTPFPAEAQVDLIHVDWQKLARLIVDRLAMPARPDAPPIVFEAEAKMRQSAAAHAQSV